MTGSSEECWVIVKVADEKQSFSRCEDRFYLFIDEWLCARMEISLRQRMRIAMHSISCDIFNERYILLWKFIGNYMKEVIFVNVLQVRGSCLILLYWNFCPCQQWFNHTHKCHIPGCSWLCYNLWHHDRAKVLLTAAWTAPGDIICVSSLLYSLCNYL